MDGTSSKHQRPCDNCRRRKIRCLFASDEAVSCVLCVSRSAECTYVQSAPRKKRQLSADEDKAGSAGGSRPAKQRQRTRRRESNDAVLRDYVELAGQSLLKETLGHQNRQSSSVIGATSHFDRCLTRSVQWNRKGECLSFDAPNILRRASPAVHFTMRQDTQTEMDTELANLDAIEDFVAPHGPELVKLYFRIVHPSFPILHKKVFLEKHGRSYRELTPTGLGAVYIMALNWWSYSPALSNLPRPDAKKLEAQVLRMLFEVHERPKISDLQGGLVLLQCPNVNSWALTGHLVAMAQNLGINLDCSDWQVPDWERGVRRRVAWALFMQDKWGALVYGRGCLIRRDDWDVQPLETSDFPETAQDDDVEQGSAEVERGKQTFLHLVSLSEILADILDQFFTLKATRRQQNIHEVLEKAKPLQLKLKAWYSSLPLTLSISETVPRKLSSVGYLHLAYYTAEITLHRAILRAHAIPSPQSELYTITRLAASTRFTAALNFVQSLRAEQLQSFWYFSSSLSLIIIGLFGGILCSSTRKEDQQERDSYIAQLSEYRWVLRVNATSASFMKSAVGMLDSRSQHLEQLFGPGATWWDESPTETATLHGSPEDGDGERDSENISPSIDDLFLSLQGSDELLHPPQPFGQDYYELDLGDMGTYI